VERHGIELTSLHGWPIITEVLPILYVRDEMRREPTVQPRRLPRGLLLLLCTIIHLLFLPRYPGEEAPAYRCFRSLGFRPACCGVVRLLPFQSNFRFWMRGNLEAFRGAWGTEKTTWMLLSILYVIAIVAAISVALYSRRRSLVIYNIDHIELEASIPEVFERLARPIERRGKRWIGAVPYFELDSNDGGRTVTIRWISDDLALFTETDRLIRDVARPLAPEDNPAAPWLMAIAGGLAVWAAGSFGFLLVYFFSLK